MFRDVIMEVQDVSKLIDAFEKTVPRELVDVELGLHFAWATERLGMQIDLDLGSAVLMDVIHQFGVQIDIDLDWKQAVLERIALEDIGETSRNHCADAPVVEGPRCMLAGGAATEVVAGKKDLGALGLWMIENETMVWRAVFVVPPVAEKLVSQAFFGRDLEKAGRNDLVGIDVVDWKRYRVGMEFRELGHGLRFA